MRRKILKWLIKKLLPGHHIHKDPARVVRPIVSIPIKEELYD